MNRTLLVFSLLLIFGGILVGLFFLPVIGVFLLLIALASPSSAPKPSQTQTKTQTPNPPYRMPARARTTTSTPAPIGPETSIPTTSMSPTTENFGGSYPSPPPAAPAMSYDQRMTSGNTSLFPTTMFPSFGPTQPPMQPTTEGTQSGAKPQSGDELLELVALVAILSLTSRRR